MKIILLFLAAVGLTLVVGHYLGWQNLGNPPPVVPQKLVAIGSAPEPVLPKADTNTIAPIAASPQAPQVTK